MCVQSFFLTKKTLEQIAVTNSLFILLYLLHPPNHDDLPLFVDDSCSSLPLPLPSVEKVVSIPNDGSNVEGGAAVLDGGGDVLLLPLM
jgi:hypothetical protein